MTFKGRLFYGIDRFLFESSHRLKGKRIGLLTNNSALTVSIPGPRVPARLALQRAGLKISCLFSNRHGLFLEGRQLPSPTTDPLTNLPIVSFSSLDETAIQQILSTLDAVIVDIPDPGVRFLSDFETLAKLLSSCASIGLPIWIFDRPNPLGGLVKWVEGPLRNTLPASKINFTIKVPIRHSLTLAEIATMWHHEKGFTNLLQVSLMEGWQRRLMLPHLVVSQTPTHPETPDFRVLLLASCTGLFSSLNINFGLGSPLGFRVFGAPWIDAHVFLTAVNEFQMDGVDFHPTYFRAVSSPYQGQICGGLMVHVSSANHFKPIETGLRLIHLLHLFYPEKCTWRSSPSFNELDQTASTIFGRDDIPLDLARLPYSRADHVKSWTQVKGWTSYCKNWLLY